MIEGAGFDISAGLPGEVASGAPGGAETLGASGDPGAAGGEGGEGAAPILGALLPDLLQPILQYLRGGAGGDGGRGGAGGRGGDGAAGGEGGLGGAGGAGAPGMVKLAASVIRIQSGEEAFPVIIADHAGGVEADHNGKFSYISNMKEDAALDNLPDFSTP